MLTDLASFVTYVGVIVHITSTCVIVFHALTNGLLIGLRNLIFAPFAIVDVYREWPRVIWFWLGGLSAMIIGSTIVRSTDGNEQIINPKSDLIILALVFVIICAIIYIIAWTFRKITIPRSRLLNNVDNIIVNATISAHQVLPPISPIITAPIKDSNLNQVSQTDIVPATDYIDTEKPATSKRPRFSTRRKKILPTRCRANSASQKSQPVAASSLNEHQPTPVVPDHNINANRNSHYEPTEQRSNSVQNQQNTQAESIKQMSENKGRAFEEYVLTRFSKLDYTLKEWRSDKFVSGWYAQSSLHPDLELQNIISGHSFAIECKYRQNYFNDGVEFARPDQLSRYRQFRDQKKCCVYIAIGVGGIANSPTDFYVINLNDIPGPFLSRKFMQDYIFPSGDIKLEYC